MPEISSFDLEDFHNIRSFRYWLWRGLVVIAVTTVALMWGCPQYDVWQQGLKGQAELARAEQNRQVAVAVSRAHAEAAGFEAAADTLRAHGISRSNAIIASGLTGEAGARYIEYLYVQGIKEKEHVIYVPTEAGMPILEAGRRP